MIGNVDDFFNCQVNMPTAEEHEIVEWRPNAKKGQNQIYDAVVRFIPNPMDPANKSIVMKYTAFLKNNATNESKEVDCPSTIGQPDMIQDTFFSFRNSDNPILKENSKMFSRRQRFASLVQILSCKSEPALVGKILVWRYGIKIHEKIFNEMNPPVGVPRNPFNMLTGRPMYVKVKIVSGFNNFDDSQFIDIANPVDGALRINITNAQGTVVSQPITQDVIASNPAIKDTIFNYLKDNCPSLEPYEYHEWDDSTRSFVQNVINVMKNPQLSVQAQANPGFMSQPAMTPHVTSTQQVTPTAVAAPVNPISGLNMGTSATDMSQTTPGGFNATNIPGGDALDSLLGNSAAAPTNPTSGMSLDDVLSGIM